MTTVVSRKEVASVVVVVTKSVASPWRSTTYAVVPRTGIQERSTRRNPMVRVSPVGVVGGGEAMLVVDAVSGVDDALARMLSDGGGVFGVGLTVHASRIVMRVFGPTSPYPVVAGVPVATICSALWNALTAVSVTEPK